jgi:hypothetical protein
LVIDIEKMLTNLFSTHHLRGIKKSLASEFKLWLKKEGREIFVEDEKNPIYLSIEIGNRKSL